MKYHASFVIFEKTAKIEIVICCELYVALYGLIENMAGLVKTIALNFSTLRVIRTFTFNDNNTTDIKA